MSPTRDRPLILLVEDDPSMRELIREVCHMQGYEARESGTGRAGLQLAAADRPDLVLLDWELPDISGIEVAQELRRMGLMSPILMLTGRSDDRDVVTGLEHGVDEYLTKPIRPRVLAARMAANLRRAKVALETPDGDIAGRLETLEKVSIFLHWPDGALRRLARRAVLIQAKAGATLLNQGEPNNFLFVVESGSVQVALARAAGKMLPIALLAESDFFGAVSVLTGQAAAATVTAREDVSLLKIPREALEAAMPPGTPARSEFERVVAQRQTGRESAHRRTAGTGSTRLVSLYSPKGGVGKTTLAINVAAALAANHHGEVVLADFSLPYNHAAVLAHLVPSTSLARLADVTDDFGERVESGLAYHRSGFLVLTAALAPEEADLITPALVKRALDELGARFQIVIVDLGSVLTEVVLSVLERSQSVYMVASPELLTVNDLRRVKEILRDVLRLQADQVHLVLNHRAKGAGVSKRDVEQLLGVSVDLEIPHDGKRPEEAALRGEILVVRAPRSPIAKAAVRLARLIDGDSASKEPRGSR